MKKDDEVTLLPEEEEVELLPDVEGQSFESIGKQAMTGPGTPYEGKGLDTDEVEVTREMAARFGLSNGLSGSWDENIRAAGGTAAEMMEAAASNFMKRGIQGTIDAMPDIQDTFNTHLKAEKDMEAKAREKYPYTYGMTDMAGILAGEAATYGMAKYLKAGKALSGFETLAAQTGFSLVHGIGRTEEDTIEGMAKDAAIEVGLSTAPIAGQFLGKTKLGTKAIKSVGNLAEKTQVPAFLRFLGAKATTFENSVKEFGKDAVDLVDRVLNYTNADGKIVINPVANRKQVLSDVANEADAAGRMMKQILVEADQVNQKGVPMDARRLWSKLKLNIFNDVHDGVYKTLDQKKIAKYKALEEEVYVNLFDASEDEIVEGALEAGKKYIPNELLNFGNLHDYVSDQFRYSRGSGKMFDSIDKDVMMTRKRVAQVMHEHLDDQISSVASPDLLKRYTEARTRFGDLKTVETALDVSMGKDKSKEIMRTLFREKLFVAGSLAASAGLGLQDPVVGTTLAAASAVGMLATSRRLNGIISHGASRVAAAFRANPDKYGDLAAKLMAASAISGEAFTDELYLTSAKVDLMEKPLARTSEDVFKRRSQILAIVNEIDEETGNNLKKAIDESNTTEIGSIMTQLSQKAKPGLIQDGMGWDGIAWDPGTQEAVEKSLRKNLTPREQTLLIPRFREDNKIPPEYYGKASPNPMNRIAYMARKNKITNPEI